MPSGVWDITEYDKLPRYDQATGHQPTAVFQCHLTDEDKHPTRRRRAGGTEAALARICAGWAGCHDGDNLLSLRMAVHSGVISVETAQLARDYESPVPLWESGTAAAAHGLGAILDPPEEARRVIDKLVRVYGKTQRQCTVDKAATAAPGHLPSVAPVTAVQPETATAEPVRTLRAARAIHGFLVDSAGFDAGEAMLEQAAELADLLADAGVFTPSPASPPGVDAVTLIRAYIVDSSGEDLGPLTTHHAEDLRDALAAAGLLGDGLHPAPPHRPAALALAAQHGASRQHWVGAKRA